MPSPGCNFVLLLEAAVAQAKDEGLSTQDVVAAFIVLLADRATDDGYPLSAIVDSLHQAVNRRTKAVH